MSTQQSVDLCQGESSVDLKSGPAVRIWRDDFQNFLRTFLSIDTSVVKIFMKMR